MNQATQLDPEQFDCESMRILVRLRELETAERASGEAAARDAEGRLHELREFRLSTEAHFADMKAMLLEYLESRGMP
ncbi:hypothetical protein [Nocardia mexicana]|uniref:Uncharacterized protein n=1 Tax=Nocardia mexicana TaxID=279262 RepID=A0A370H3G1_9NOCA|nr:hypothetical protein [Nocardia mexicana]RDI50760.1 hypothetical protein DFR68_105237 [Nocardia mexicana]